jgi:hypothetical protein
MRATDKRIELLPPQLNAREIRLDGVFTRDSVLLHTGDKVSSASKELHALPISALWRRYPT